jgi:tripartite-type tricarboxylate transporter receptor subunit TctC
MLFTSCIVSRVNALRTRCLLQRLIPLLAILSLPLTSPASPQPIWPSERPIHLIVPFPAGSSPDLLARTLAIPLANKLDQSIVVENKPGAGGNIGTRFVARAPADGYTLLYTINGPLVTAPTLYKKSLGYDPVKDLAPITLVATSPNVLIVHAGFSGNTTADFVKQAGQQAGRWNYGSVGPGSASHLAMELFKKQTALDLTHIPYSGFPQVTTAVIAQDIQAAFMVPAIAMAQVKSGKVKALGITSKTPIASLPGIAPLTDQGFAEFEAISWNAVLAPAGTPTAILTRLNAELVALLNSDDIRDKFALQYFSAVGSSPAALKQLIQDEQRRWDAVIETLKLSLD